MACIILYGISVQEEVVPFLKPLTLSSKLFRKLRGLVQHGWRKVESKGSGRFGLTIEKSLGIPPNSSRTPDFMGIEIKTKRDNSLQTFFF